MKNCWRTGAGALAIAIVVVLAGCRAESDHSAEAMKPGAVVDIDAEIARASAVNRPILMLVYESGPNSTVDSVGALLDSPGIKSRSDAIVSILMDIRISRNRATVTRFHIPETPVLLCLSPRGVIVSRDDGPLTEQLMARRIDEAIQQAPPLDAKLGSLETAVGRNPRDAQAQLEIAAFLLAQHNAREAIPYLAAVARSETADTTLRVGAWVNLVRAHLWIGEPEKGRHEAKNLIEVLGPRTPEARAGGELVLGTQDANAKRVALARREFEEAISAAPDSIYARQAADAMAKLPKVEQ